MDKIKARFWPKAEDGSELLLHVIFLGIVMFAISFLPEDLQPLPYICYGVVMVLALWLLYTIKERHDHKDKTY